MVLRRCWINIIANGYHIRHSSDYQSSSHSDLQALNDLRELLPHPISVMDDYLIGPSQSNQPNRRQTEEEVGEEVSEEFSFGEQSELALKIAEQTHHIFKMQQEIYYFRTQFFKIAAENQRHLDTLRQFQHLQDKLLQLTRQQESKLKEEEAERHKREQQNQAKERELETLRQLKDKEIKALKYASNKGIEVLRLENNREIEALKQLKNNEIKALSQLKERQLEALKKEISFLRRSQADSDSLLHGKLTEQLRFQESIILDLSMKNENIMRINSFLKQELTIAQQKLIQLQNQMQQKFFGSLSENLVRLKENHNLINRKPEPQNNPTQHLLSKLQEDADQDTIKLTSRRESGPELREQRYHREVKTVEKEREGYSPLIDKMKPLEQPKPQRKFYRAVDIQPVKRFKQTRRQGRFLADLSAKQGLNHSSSCESRHIRIAAEHQNCYLNKGEQLQIRHYEKLMNKY